MANYYGPLVEGSEVQKGFGVRPDQRDGAEISAIIEVPEGLPTTHAALMALAEAELPTSWNVNGRSVSLATIRVRAIDNTSFLARANYRNFNNRVTTPSDPDFTDARFQLGFEYVMSYRNSVSVYDQTVGGQTLPAGTPLFDLATGLPDGDLIESEYSLIDGTLYATTPPRGKPYRVGVLRVQLYGTGPTLPTGDFSGAVGKVNGLPQTIAGFVGQAGEIRFDGLQLERVLKGDDTYEYPYSASYTLRQGGFAQHALVKDSITPSGGDAIVTYDTEIENRHEFYKVLDNGQQVAAQLPVPPPA